MTKKQLIKVLKLQIQIVMIQLQILLLRRKMTVPNLDAPKKIIIHHGGGNLDFLGVNAYHKYKWGFRSSLGYYIGYQCFINRDGSIHQGRADNEEGAHTKGHNKNSIGICLMGNGCEKDFTTAQYASLNGLVKRKMREYNITKIYPHSQFTATLCPSERLIKWIKEF